MRINLSPQRRNDNLTLRRNDNLTLRRDGDALVINGAVFDFTPLSEGAVLPREAVDCPYLADDVTRQGGAVQITLVLPIGMDAGEGARFPEPILDPANGAIALPEQDVVEYPSAQGVIDWAQIVPIESAQPVETPEEALARAIAEASRAQEQLAAALAAVNGGADK
jgi:hypothetical protein